VLGIGKGTAVQLVMLHGLTLRPPSDDDQIRETRRQPDRARPSRWVAPGEEVSRLEDEDRLSAGLPRLIYVKSPAPAREPRLSEMLARNRDTGGISYQHFSDPAELAQLVENDLAVLLSERFEMAQPGAGRRERRGAGRAVPVPAAPPPVASGGSRLWKMWWCGRACGDADRTRRGSGRAGSW
jgi:hypothetical protein